MRQTVRPSFLMTLVASCILAGLFFPAYANETSISEAFERADPSKSIRTEISYNIKGCMFQHIIVNINYCGLTGLGERDRTIIKNIDLAEVDEIKISRTLGKFFMNFELDYGAPGTAFILLDRIMNGSEGAFEIYSERIDAALASADLNSGSTFSNCDGTPPTHESKQVSLTLITEVEPEGWLRLVDLARECRSPKHLKLSGE